MVVWGFWFFRFLGLGVSVDGAWLLGSVVWGLLGFWGWGFLYKHKRLTLGKKVHEHSSYCVLHIISNKS